jgi:hypothetical protein
MSITLFRIRNRSDERAAAMVLNVRQKGDQNRKVASRRRRPICANLVGVSTILLSSTFSRQSLLHTLLCARLQVVGVSPHFLNDVFRLNLTLETTQSILQ